MRVSRPSQSNIRSKSQYRYAHHTLRCWTGTRPHQSLNTMCGDETYTAPCSQRSKTRVHRRHHRPHIEAVLNGEALRMKATVKAATTLVIRLRLSTLPLVTRSPQLPTVAHTLIGTRTHRQPHLSALIHTDVAWLHRQPPHQFMRLHVRVQGDPWPRHLSTKHRQAYHQV